MYLETHRKYVKRLAMYLKKWACLEIFFRQSMDSISALDLEFAVLFLENEM